MSKNVERRLPPKAEALYNMIRNLKGGRSGCWDILAWKGKTVLFVEAKGLDVNDSIDLEQWKWLEATLQVRPDCEFAVVEWSAR